MLGTVVVILFGSINTYTLPRDRRLEYFNEATIMLCVYHYYVFTDFVSDPVARYQTGYSLIAVTCINLAVNMIVMVYVTAKLLKFNCKKSLYTRRNKKVMLQL
jgi:hypothetical protein